jgi:hypothetical protein
MLHAPRAERSKGTPVLSIIASLIITLYAGLTRCLKCNTLLCGQQGRRLSDPRAHLYIKPSRSYGHCANRSYIVPEAHRTNYACSMCQGRSDPRAHLCLIQSKLHIYSANRTYQVPEVLYNYMRAARLQVERSKGSPPYQA